MKLASLIFLLNLSSTFGQVIEAPDVRFPNSQMPANDSVVIFCSCDAQFPGGLDAMRRHIYNYLTPAGKEKGQATLSKKGVIAFIVEADGRLMDIEILQQVSPEIDDLMLRIIEEMPRWIPACDCYGNGAVRSRVRLPITFTFPEN
ncbi:MAG: hypothetical protein AB8B56_05205 [Crocinitomicaceae bacterium]